MENLETNNGLEKFVVVCVKTLDRFAPYKKKYLRGNNMPFMNKSLSRTFMRRSQLRSVLKQTDWHTPNNVTFVFFY